MTDHSMTASTIPVFGSVASIHEPMTVLAHPLFSMPYEHSFQKQENNSFVSGVSSRRISLLFSRDGYYSKHASLELHPVPGAAS